MGSMVIPAEAFGLASSAETGSPAMRKLLPALFHRDASGPIPAQSRIRNMKHPHIRALRRALRALCLGEASHEPIRTIM